MGKDALLQIQIDALEAELAELKKDKERLALLEQSAHEAVFVFDGTFRCVDLNSQAVKTFGLSREQALGKNISYFMAVEYRGMAQAHAYARFNKPFEAVMQRKDGTTFYALLQGDDLPYRGNTVRVMTCRDISNIKQMQTQLKEMAQNDSLTGIFNRGYFIELCEREISRSKRYAHPLALVMIDIDHFKKINDTIGHSGGDRAIQHVVKVCRGSIRETDILGRIGGEEFALMMIESSLENAVMVAERIRMRLIESTPDEAEGIPAMTVSMGVSAVAPPASLEDALKTVDALMYRAKEEGRNRVCY